MSSTTQTHSPGETHKLTSNGCFTHSFKSEDCLAESEGTLRKKPEKGLLASYLPGRSLILAGAILLALISTALSLTQPLVVQNMINAVQSNNPLGMYVIVFGALALAIAVTASFQFLILGKFGADIVRATRKKLVARMLSLPMREHHRLAPGELSSRLTADPALIQSAVSEGLVTAASSLLMLLGATGALLYLDAVTFAFAFSAAAVSLLIALFAGKRVKRLRLSAQSSLGEMSAEVQRAAIAMPLLRAYNATAEPINRLHHHIDRTYSSSVDLAKLFAVVQPLSATLTQISLGCTILIGGVRVASGDISLSTLIAFLMFFSMIIQPLSSLNSIIYLFQEASAGHERIKQISESPSETWDDETDAKANQYIADLKAQLAPPTVTFTNVSFTYAPPITTLDGVTFTARAGLRTAVVGPTGAGKTTLFALLERFYNTDGGTISINDVDITEIPRKQLRSLIGYVDQSSIGTSGTIRENLTLGQPGVSNKKILETLESLGLHSLLERMNHNLDHEIGEGANQLSGGERQRISIARAVLSNPLILLLDEPTASLDGQTEAELAKFLDERSSGITMLTIAHRLSTVIDADHIVVLDAGRIVATGTHEELLRTCNLYANLVESQLIR